MTREEWLQQFRQETDPVIVDPFLSCLAEAIATVESGGGQKAIHERHMLNEIGYKAVAGKPSTSKDTKEAGESGIQATRAAFRLFRDRVEQATSLLYLMRTSAYFDAARLMFLLTFYAGYAPGRSDGIGDLLAAFNRIAATGAHPGVRPIRFLDNKLAEAADLGDEERKLNHKAIRDAVMTYGKMCINNGHSMD